ncbi:MAG TPA: hypothetical protein PK447_10335, partial [Ignavibacteria bacterium]|nr:hypothetical protein [Ignavibacteria bacterium]
MRHLTFFLLIIFSFLLYTAVSYGDTKTASSGNWSTPAIWSPNGVPASTDDIIIPTGVKVTLDISFSLNAGHTLTIDGTGVIIFQKSTGNSSDTLMILGTIKFTSNSQNSIDGAQQGTKQNIFVLGNGALLISDNPYGVTGANCSITADPTHLLINLSNSANFEFNFAGSQNMLGMPATVNNLILSGSGTKTLAAATTVNGALTIGSGATFTVVNGTNNFALTSNGDFTNNGTFTAGTGTVTLSGSSAQTLGGNTATTFNNLAMNNSAGVTLGNNEIVGGTLTLTSGKITTGTNALTLGTSTSLLGTLSPATPSSSSYIVGNFERWFSNTTNTGMVWFPVGTVTSFRPAGIQFTSVPSAGGKILVAGNNTDPGTKNAISSLTDGTYTIDRYSKEAWWQVTPTGLTGGTYSISLGAYNISGVSTTNFTLLRVLKRADANSDWGFLGNHSNATGTYTSPVVKRTGLSGFSQFGIGGNSTDGNYLNDSPLPVSLASFTTNVSGRNITLKWTTSGETNNSGFNIERKGFSGDFVKVGFVQGKGTVSTPSSYEFTDRNLVSGK